MRRGDALHRRLRRRAGLLADAGEPAHRQVSGHRGRHRLDRLAGSGAPGPGRRRRRPLPEGPARLRALPGRGPVRRRLRHLARGQVAPRWAGAPAGGSRLRRQRRRRPQGLARRRRLLQPLDDRAARRRRRARGHLPDRLPHRPRRRPDPPRWRPALLPQLVVLQRAHADPGQGRDGGALRGQGEGPRPRPLRELRRGRALPLRAQARPARAPPAAALRRGVRRHDRRPRREHRPRARRPRRDGQGQRHAGRLHLRQRRAGHVGRLADLQRPPGRGQGLDVRGRHPGAPDRALAGADRRRQPLPGAGDLPRLLPDRARGRRSAAAAGAARGRRQLPAAARRRRRPRAGGDLLALPALRQPGRHPGLLGAPRGLEADRVLRGRAAGALQPARRPVRGPRPGRGHPDVARDLHEELAAWRETVAAKIPAPNPGRTGKSRKG